jgi:type VI secretion system secreted protein Hcp
MKVKSRFIGGSVMKNPTMCLVVSLVLVLGTVSFGAETVHLFLTGKSQGWIKGESTQISLGRADSIEAAAYTQMVVGEPDPKTGITGEVRNHFPVTILKRLDKSTPKLFLAWHNHELLTAVFKFYRPNPSGDGTTHTISKIKE